MKRALFHWVLIALPLTVAVPAHAQVSALKNAVETPKPHTSEKPEDTQTRLQQWLQESRDLLARFEDPNTASTLPEGVTVADLESRRRALEQLVLTLTRSLKTSGSNQDATKELETARAEDSGWTGFTEAPPYSILLIDDLLNERDATKSKLSSYSSSLANYQHLLTGILEETKTAEDAVSERIVALQRAEGNATAAAKWHLEAARAKSRLAATRAGLIQNEISSLTTRVSAAETELALLDRKLEIAKAKSRFSDEDLDVIKKLSAERKSAIRKEIDSNAKRLKTALAARSQAQAALEKLGPPDAENPDTDGTALAKFRVRVTDGRVEALQSIGEGLESLIQLEDVITDAYQDRRAVLHATSPEDHRKYLDSLVTLVERLQAWKIVLDHQLTDTSADLSKLEARAASVTSDDPRFSLLNEQRATLSEKLTTLQRVSQAVITQRRVVKRWVTEFTPAEEETGLMPQIKSLASTGMNAWQKIWTFKVMTFEDKVEVDGEIITGKIPVTLGMLLRALMFFVIGYWLFLMVAKRIQKTLVATGRIEDAQAKTLRNWAMIVVGFLLAIGTLSVLKIPLTVFAFLGGALAIGLGFGTQTLIKNFISGIIVLVERKIRVGDVLDVDGIVGTVTEINTRSSVIRSADELETMIPNSVFLENRVTNWTLSSSKVRRFLRLGVAYGSSPQQVMEVLTDAASRHGLVCKDPAPFAVFEDFGDSALIFCLYYWLEIGSGTNRMIVGSDLRLMVEKRFTELGIGVPFPQRDININSGNPITVRIASDEK